MTESDKCSLCRWYDYDSDWGGNRWNRGFKTLCPECGKHFSGKKDAPILSTTHPFLMERLKRRKSIWYKLKTFFVKV